MPEYLNYILPLACAVIIFIVFLYYKIGLGMTLGEIADGLFRTALSIYFLAALPIAVIMIFMLNAGFKEDKLSIFYYSGMERCYPYTDPIAAEKDTEPCISSTSSRRGSSNNVYFKSPAAIPESQATTALLVNVITMLATTLALSSIFKKIWPAADKPKNKLVSHDTDQADPNWRYDPYAWKKRKPKK